MGFPKNYDHRYALDPYRHLGRIVATRFLGFSCRRRLNPSSFGDRRDCVSDKAHDKSTCVDLPAVISNKTVATRWAKRF